MPIALPRLALTDIQKDLPKLNQWADQLAAYLQELNSGVKVALKNNQSIASGKVGGGSGTVTSITAGTGLTGGTITSTGTIALSTPVSVADGGTGTATPSLAAGTAIQVTGSWPDQTVASANFGASGASHSSGSVPDPGATAGTTRFLREDATWAVPSGSSGVTSLDSITGAISLHAGSNITITDNSPSAGDITIAASGGGGSSWTSVTMSSTAFTQAGSATFYLSSSPLIASVVAGNCIKVRALILSQSSSDYLAVGVANGTTSSAVSYSRQRGASQEGLFYYTNSSYTQISANTTGSQGNGYYLVEMWISFNSAGNVLSAVPNYGLGEYFSSSVNFVGSPVYLVVRSYLGSFSNIIAAWWQQIN